jgi:hypothetical protein
MTLARSGPREASAGTAPMPPTFQPAARVRAGRSMPGRTDPGSAAAASPPSRTARRLARARCTWATADTRSPAQAGEPCWSPRVTSPSGPNRRKLGGRLRARPGRAAEHHRQDPRASPEFLGFIRRERAEDLAVHALRGGEHRRVYPNLQLRIVSPVTGPGHSLVRSPHLGADGLGLLAGPERDGVLKLKRAKQPRARIPREVAVLGDARATLGWANCSSSAAAAPASISPSPATRR